MMAEEGCELVALTQVSWKQCPFYHMKEMVGTENLIRNFELTYRGVEIITGAIRERRHEAKEWSPTLKASSWMLLSTRWRGLG